MLKTNPVFNLPKTPYKHSFHHLLNKKFTVEQLPDSINWNTPEIEPSYLKAHKLSPRRKLSSKRNK